MSPRPLPAWQRPRPRGVYRVRSDRPGEECWVVWSHTGKRLACSYLVSGHDVEATREKFNRWLDDEDPLPVAEPLRSAPPSLRLIRVS